MRMKWEKHDWVRRREGEFKIPIRENMKHHKNCWGEKLAIFSFKQPTTTSTRRRCSAKGKRSKAGASSSWNWIEFHAASLLSSSARTNDERSCLSVTSRVHDSLIVCFACKSSTKIQFLISSIIHYFDLPTPHSRPVHYTHLSDTLIKMKWIFNYKKYNSVKLRSS